MKWVCTYAGKEESGEPLFISLLYETWVGASWCEQLGKAGSALGFHFADEGGREHFYDSWRGIYVLTNLTSYEWIHTDCEEVAELARKRGARLARAFGKISYGARIDFRGWEGENLPRQSGRVISIIPGKYEEDHAFPHFTWGHKATKSVFPGGFQLLCYVYA